MSQTSNLLSSHPIGFQSASNRLPISVGTFRQEVKAEVKAIGSGPISDPAESIKTVWFGNHGLKLDPIRSHYWWTHLSPEIYLSIYIYNIHTRTLEDLAVPFKSLVGGLCLFDHCQLYSERIFPMQVATHGSRTVPIGVRGKNWGWGCTWSVPAWHLTPKDGFGRRILSARGLGSECT